MVKLGSRPIGVAEAVLGEINFLRPQQGRVKAGGSASAKRGFSFSTRASQLWRFSLGSNAAVLKKIGEEATETILAGKDGVPARIASEMAVRAATSRLGRPRCIR